MRLAYGAGAVDVDLAWADVRAVVEPPAFAPADVPALLDRACLAEPIGRPPLDELLAQRPGRVTVVIPDHTRPSGSEAVVPWVLDRCNAHGVPDEAVTVLCALGVHRPQTAAEHARLLGPAAGRVRVVDHDARNEAQLVTLGTTTRGNTVALNRLAVETDCCILTGAIAPHYFAGFGGGAKALMPGVASEAACRFSHQLIFNPGVGNGRHPAAVAGVLDGNPVHEDIADAARLAPPAFLINTVLAPDAGVIAAFAGDWHAAHRAGCAFYADAFGVDVGAGADLVVVSAGGAPKDCNLIQAHKAIHAAFPAVRPGGVMLVVAECVDGVGHARFLPWFDYPNAGAHERALRADYHMYGQTALALREKADACTIILVSALDPALVRRCGMTPAACVDDAVATVRAACAARPSTVVFPAATSVLVRPPASRPRAAV